VFGVAAGVLFQLTSLRLPANLAYQDVSQKRSTWTGKNDNISDSVIPADLSGFDLSGVWAGQAFLAGANLSNADLRSANLIYADLRQADMAFADLRRAKFALANLSGADLIGAKLSGADLSQADLREANLSGAELSNANLEYCDLRAAKGLKELGHIYRKEDVKVGVHWDKAFYDMDILKALGLPPDHNERLAEEEAKSASKGLEDLKNSAQELMDLLNHLKTKVK